jgi:integrase
VRPADIDLTRRQVTVFGKGQKSRVIPLRGRIVLEIERTYSTRSRSWVGVGSRTTFCSIRRSALPAGACSRPTPRAHERADHPPLVVPPRRCGRPRRRRNDERAEYAPGAAHVRDHLRRVTDLGAATQALGHSHLSTTAALYGHYDLSDLERAMEALARARRAEEEEPAD